MSGMNRYVITLVGLVFSASGCGKGTTEKEGPKLTLMCGGSFKYPVERAVIEVACKSPPPIRLYELQNDMAFLHVALTSARLNAVGRLEGP